MNLAKEEDIWLGQRRRMRAMDVFQKLAKELCPMPQGKFISIASYLTGLSRRKVADDYLLVLLDVGILTVNEGILHLAGE